MRNIVGAMIVLGCIAATVVLCFLISVELLDLHWLEHFI
jgi:hypothetical protein